MPRLTATIASFIATVALGTSAIAEPPLPTDAFRNEEVELSFQEPIRILSSDFSPAAEGYFSRISRQVRFCAWRRRPSDVQQLLPSQDGFLCDFYVLPPLPPEPARLEIEKNFRKKETPFHMTPPREEQIGEFRVLSWRFQKGKSRFDHYLAFGRRHNYLFVSWPYGSNGELEKLIRGMRSRPAQP